MSVMSFRVSTILEEVKNLFEFARDETSEASGVAWALGMTESHEIVSFAIDILRSGAQVVSCQIKTYNAVADSCTASEFCSVINAPKYTFTQEDLLACYQRQVDLRRQYQQFSLDVAKTTLVHALFQFHRKANGAIIEYRIQLLEKLQSSHTYMPTVPRDAVPELWKWVPESLKIMCCFGSRKFCTPINLSRENPWDRVRAHTRSHFENMSTAMAGGKTADPKMLQKLRKKDEELTRQRQRIARLLKQLESQPKPIPIAVSDQALIRSQSQPKLARFVSRAFELGHIQEGSAFESFFKDLVTRKQNPNDPSPLDPIAKAIWLHLTNTAHPSQASWLSKILGGPSIPWIQRGPRNDNTFMDQGIPLRSPKRHINFTKI